MAWCALRKESSNKIAVCGTGGLHTPSLIVGADTRVSSQPIWTLFALMIAITLSFALCAPAPARAQSGVLIPPSTEKPDPAVLSLDEMTVNVLIDNQYARVKVVQIFGNRTERVQEG